ncbi:DEAD/DEAH box helicase [Nesterenkonia halotolerans]|uniref:RNA helicase n=1 Tax=Nesterenkonia halotolerans TaxID=225325 RepID=A0ABR9J680_9MICC|nr:DEAD/DEAH box helicase [Nesterenkonia halotolerans]MBE1514349.1 superfamily II DNA/RNA helicase [Nesterenkonia halotolerans]
MTEQTTESSAAETDAPISAAHPELVEAVEASSLTFADFNVRPEIVEALAAKGITTPFPIQAETLPIALGGYDIIGQAKTGTGKTLGFGIPAIQRVTSPDDAGYDDLPAPGAPQALIVAPTRELAVQVAADIKVAAARRGIRVATIYGGRAYEPQIEELDRGVEIVVGTPGRLIDLHRQRHLKLKNVNIVVLDEADEMLDLGFLPDVETLLSAVPEIGRQTMLFSATMPGPVVAMARRYMSKPTHISAADPLDEGITKKDIRQLVYRAHHLDKDEVIARLLQAEGRGRTIVFTRTKRQADRLSAELISRGFAAGAIHGDLGQGAREQALRAFRNEKIDVLVATDVAARGIDVTDITHVINLTAPDDEKAYLHRVGRTGRAGKTGIAVTFVDWEDMPKWKLIDKALGLGIPEPIETYSSSPHLYEDLDIPKGTKGRLPRHKRSKAGLDAEELEDLGGPEKRQSRGGRSGDREGGRGGRSSDGGRGGRDSDKAGSGRGGRDGGRGRGRGEDSAKESQPAAEGSAPRSRNRRRTRTEDSGSTAEAAPAESAAPSEGGESATQPRRRRRRRGGSGSGGGNASSES